MNKRKINEKPVILSPDILSLAKFSSLIRHRMYIIRHAVWNFVF